MDGVSAATAAVAYVDEYFKGIISIRFFVV